MDNDIIFTIVELIVMVLVAFIARYVIPWLRNKIGADKLAEIEEWAKNAVLMAQQVMQGKDGADKKAYVTEFLQGLLIAKNISLSDEQLDILIESAVKQMKIAEKSQNIQ